MFKSKIEKPFEKHDRERICQGDILREFPFCYINSHNEIISWDFPYIIIITQDCDLVSDYNHRIDKEKHEYYNQFIPNIIFIPAFPIDIIKDGEHLSDFYNIKQERLNSEKVKRIKNENEARYHFLKGFEEYQVPELVLDFKLYYTSSSDYVKKHYNEHYLATVNEIFRENLSQRFANYINRIGLPI